MTDESLSPVTRRAALAGLVGATAFAPLMVRRAEATPEVGVLGVGRAIPVAVRPSEVLNGAELYCQVRA